jgi:serine/threonine protein kinase
MNSVDGENVDFSSFTIMDEIGNGSFGIVYKVQKINTGVYYAMKSLSKSVLQKQKQLKYAISECKIMKQLNHPFIVPLYFAFQTPKYLYLVLELCSNGDLFGLMEKKGKIEEQVAKFYLAEIILALEYLHGCGILYRDLKPANVLIDDEFHAKLADFGLAKEKVNQVNPAMTMAGTPAYLPPEIVAKKGATTASDIYGLGPLFFELLTGETPYYSEDIDTLFQNIKNSKLSIPDYISDQSKDFITQVMNKDPTKRPQISQIKRHQLFRKLNWEALLAKKIRPPKLN